MKAVRIHSYGGADVLRYEDAPEPKIGDDDVLIRVVGSSVNPIDWKVREGYLRGMIRHVLPFTPGWDISGVVHAVGRNASTLQGGDAVHGRPDVARYVDYPFRSRRSMGTSRVSPWAGHSLPPCS